MNLIQKKRLWFLGLVLVGLCCTTALILFALKENLNHYYSPSQIEKGEAPLNKKIRIGGIVVLNTVSRDPKSLKVSFKITDGESIIEILYEGIMPDLFAEDKGVIATGYLNQKKQFIAEQLLHKHNADYMPPEIKKTMKFPNQINQNKKKKNDS